MKCCAGRPADLEYVFDLNVCLRSGRVHFEAAQSRIRRPVYLAVDLSCGSNCSWNKLK